MLAPDDATWRRPHHAGASHSEQPVKIGVHRRPLTDVYHFLLTSSWWVLLRRSCSRISAQRLFALLYSGDGGDRERARRATSADAYFFSVQTMATIGYGKMVPQSTFANIVVTVEALFGLVGARAGDGPDVRQVLAADARASSSAARGRQHARRRAVAAWSAWPTSGATDSSRRSCAWCSCATRRPRGRAGAPLPHAHARAIVERRLRPLVDRDPPHRRSEPALRRRPRESLEASQADLVASLVGIEEATAQKVHARYAWKAAEILFDHRFADILVLTARRAARARLRALPRRRAGPVSKVRSAAAQKMGVAARTRACSGR